MPRLSQELSRILGQGPVRAENGWSGIYELPPDFAVFEGHFPGFPILPAFVQVQMAQHLLERALDRPLFLSGLDAAKFTAKAGPGDRLAISCREGNIPGVWLCRIAAASRDGEVEISRFRLKFADERENTDAAP